MWGEKRVHEPISKVMRKRGKGSMGLSKLKGEREGGSPETVQFIVKGTLGEGGGQWVKGRGEGKRERGDGGGGVKGRRGRWGKG